MKSSVLKIALKPERMTGPNETKGSDKIARLYNPSAPVKMAMCYFICSCWDVTDMLIIKHVNCTKGQIFCRHCPVDGRKLNPWGKKASPTWMRS